MSMLRELQSLVWREICHVPAKINTFQHFILALILQVQCPQPVMMAMILPGYQNSDSASSSKFHHLALLVALVSHSSNFHNWPLLALFMVLMLD